ncbi:hypothetical protein HNQ91_001260 [Filimonas zeae]|nr:RagB/SusD family nutrient uptake outer membrane protein [Filimonas zeae]MDR6338238.1 hypothetical protein [Filimonas zeae]
MKKVCLYITLGLAMGSAGCNKFLDKDPDVRAQLNSPEKVAQLIATAYPNMNHWTFTEAASDNASDRTAGSTEFESQDAYMFRDVIRANQQDSPEGYWGACYQAVAAANEALSAIAKAPNQAAYSAQKGEALVARAYSHFMLVNLFSKFYNATTAKNDPGIPYVTEPENVVVKQYERKTVQYVYDMIKKDLTEGLPLIKDEKYSVPSYHFTRAAAHAFAARYYLYIKQYDSVLTHTAQVFSDADVATRLRKWNTSYQNMTRLELMSTYQKATEPANLLLAETVSLYARYVGSSRYAFSPANRPLIVRVPAIYSDTSKAEYAFNFQVYGSEYVNVIPKVNEYFVRASVNAEIGWPYVMTPLFTMEEALFNRVEAMIAKGNSNGAVGLLNAWLSTRISGYNPVKYTLTAQKATDYYGKDVASSLKDLTLAYKRAEFLHEGMRWFDIIRNDLAVTHTTNNGQTYRLDANHRYFQIPQSAVLSGVELNPR